MIVIRLCSACSAPFPVQKGCLEDWWVLCPPCQPASLKRAHAIASRNVELTGIREEKRRHHGWRP